MRAAASLPENRWELYKLLGEPVRLRLLALAGAEELTIGELAELLGEGQPNVSRHAKLLERAGLVVVRRQGNRALVRLTDRAAGDPVVIDAVTSGQGLCADDGSLARVAEVVRARDAASRAFFEGGGDRTEHALPAELPAYLSALAPLLPRRRLAVDAGAGDGRLLEVLAPVYERVVAVDRSEARLAAARERLARNGYEHVETLVADLDDPAVRERVDALGGADAVFASRVLHHAPKPGEVVAALARLAAPGGAVVVLDYCAHHDEGLRDRQADLWLGFERGELLSHATAAGLSDPCLRTIPAARCGGGPDGHLDWQVLVARRPPDPNVS